MINTDKMHISCITLLAACACNLTCKYCNIGSSKNKNTAELMEKNVEALQNGEYLKNVIKVLNRLEQNSNQINDFQIWGGEPTLIVGYLADRWDEWAKAFPQIRSILYSSNGMDKVQDVLRFIKAVEQYSLQNVDITLQLSFDGDYGEESVRGGKTDIIKSNYSWLCEQLNNTDLEKVHVHFQGHGVLSFDLLEHLNSIEAVHKYAESLDDFIKLMSNKCKNSHIHFFTESIQWQSGGNTSSWEGTDFRKKLQLFELASKSNDYLVFNRAVGPRQQILGGSWKTIDQYFKESEFKTLDEFCEWAITTKEGRVKISNALYCSTSLHDLKIAYDGTVLMCQNDLFRMVDLETKTDSRTDCIHKTRLKHNQLVNLLTSSDDEINKYLYFINSARWDGLLTAYHSLCNMMYILASAGQISPTYLVNPNKISKHAFLLVMIDACYHNTITDTGSAFLRGINNIRLFANGILDDMEDILVKSKLQKNQSCTKCKED